MIAQPKMDYHMPRVTPAFLPKLALSQAMGGQVLTCSGACFGLQGLLEHWQCLLQLSACLGDTAQFHVVHFPQVSAAF
jgi:hypothetical protein